MTEQQLLDRAERAGWTWMENVVVQPWGSKAYPATGWQHGNSFQHCKIDQKLDALRAQVNPSNTDTGRGFDHDLDCVECGTPIWLHYLKPCEDELRARRECFTCNHWMNLIRGGNGIVIEKAAHYDSSELPRLVPPFHRYHYQAGTAKKPHAFNGFGGRKFVIEFFDGRILETCDLWHQGKIPERFFDRLPVNARFRQE